MIRKQTTITPKHKCPICEALGDSVTIDCVYPIFITPYPEFTLTNKELIEWVINRIPTRAIECDKCGKVKDLKEDLITKKEILTKLNE